MTLSHGDNRPLSEIFSRTGYEHADLEAAASLLEDLQGAFLAEKIALMGDMPHNRAENAVKASSEWREYIQKKIKARQMANRKKIELEAIKMRHREWIAQDANERTAARM